MTVIEMLEEARRKGIDNLCFEWVDGESVMVPTVDLLMTLPRYTKENRERIPGNWREEIKELLSNSDVILNVIGHIVWCRCLSLDWRLYIERAIYKALAEAMLKQ